MTWSVYACNPVKELFYYVFEKKKKKEKWKKNKVSLNSHYFSPFLFHALKVSAQSPTITPYLKLLLAI